MDEIKTKVMITKKYLEQLYELLSKRLDIDIKQWDMVTQPGSIRLNTIGEIERSVKSIKFELTKIETAISLAKDMEKGLVKRDAGKNS